MPPRTAPEAGIETDDDDLLASWGVDGDDEDETGPESPELANDEGPAATAAQADEDATLPGEADGDEAAPAQPEAPAAEAAQPEAQPEATATADVPADPATPAEVTPWSFTADGKTVTVARSQIFEAVVDPATGRKEQFILTPKDEWMRTIQPHLADRGKWGQEKRQLLEQVAQLAPENHADVIRAQELTKFLWSLFDQEPEQLVEMVAQLKAERPVWDAKQEAAAARAQLAARDAVKQEPDAQLAELDEQELEQTLQTGLRHHLTEALKDPALAGIAPDRAFKLLWRAAPQIFFEAAEDMPEAGLKKGERGILLNEMRAILTEEVEYAKQLRGRASTVSEIEKANAAALGKPTPPKPKPRAPAKPKDEEDDVDPWADVLNTDDD
jgi:hypothetical protein